jgi:hypothetical protein
VFCQIAEACPEVAKADARQVAKAAEVEKAAARQVLRSIQRLHTHLDFSTVFESAGTHLAIRYPAKYCVSRCRPYRKPTSPAAICGPHRRPVQRCSHERDLTAFVDEFTGPTAQKQPGAFFVSSQLVFHSRSRTQPCACEMTAEDRAGRSGF